MLTLTWDRLSKTDSNSKLKHQTPSFPSFLSSFSLHHDSWPLKTNAIIIIIIIVHHRHHHHHHHRPSSMPSSSSSSSIFDGNHSSPMIFLFQSNFFCNSSLAIDFALVNHTLDLFNKSFSRFFFFECPLLGCSYILPNILFLLSSNGETVPLYRGVPASFMAGTKLTLVL